MKSKLITPEIVTQVKEELDSGLSTRNVVEKLKKKVNNLTLRNVNEILNGKFDDLVERVEDTRDNLQELNDKIEDSTGYEVMNEYYIFYKKDEKFRLKISTADAMFKDFSKHGNNLSQEEIIKKYKIKPEFWHLLKNRLRLYKASNVVSPITLERASDEEIQDIIDEAIDDHIQDRYKDRFVKTFEKKKDADYIKKSKILSNYDYLLEHLQSFLEDYKPREINFDCEKIKNNDEMTVFFADLHLGKMNSDNVLARLNKMTLELINRPERIVNIVCLGDLFETIARGGMHKGQIENMDGPFEFDLLMKTVHILEEMLMALTKAGKKVNFHGLGGNHDRFTAGHDDTQKGIGALIVYEMLSRGLSNLNVNINLLKEDWNTIDVQGFRYILAHGDNGANRKANTRATDIAWKLGKQGVHNIVVTADWHHKKEDDPSDDVIRLLIPAMAGANEYDTKLNLKSSPGYVIVTKDMIDGTPCTFTRRFLNK